MGKKGIIFRGKNILWKIKRKNSKVSYYYGRAVQYEQWQCTRALFAVKSWGRHKQSTKGRSPLHQIWGLGLDQFWLSGRSIFFISILVLNKKILPPKTWGRAWPLSPTQTKPMVVQVTTIGKLGGCLGCRAKGGG